MDWVFEKVSRYPAVKGPTGAVVTESSEKRMPMAYILNVPDRVRKRRVKDWALEKLQIPQVGLYTVSYAVNRLGAERLEGVPILEWNLSRRTGAD